jgi:pilus assembly protein CpaC
MEVSRTKLRKLGFDWAIFSGNDSIISNAAGIISGSELDPMTGITTITTAAAETITARIIDSTSFFLFIEALRQHQLLKVLAEPTLVTVSGRPASFSSGGEFPIQVAGGLGTNTIEYREFGTRVDFVPIVLGDGRVRLEVRPQVSERDPTLAGSPDLPPGLRTRWVDTAVEMNAGQTLALAGLIQSRIESENRGIPWLADLPWVGAAFRRVEETYNEVELLIMVTPEFVAPLDAHDVPPCGPGQLTTSPNDVDLYWRGYLEVPACCPDGSCGQCQAGGEYPAGYETPMSPMSPAAPADPAPAGGAAVPVEQASHARAAPLPRLLLGTQGEPSLIGPSGYDDLR